MLSAVSGNGKNGERKKKRRLYAVYWMVSFSVAAFRFELGYWRALWFPRSSMMIWKFSPGTKLPLFVWKFTWYTPTPKPFMSGNAAHAVLPVPADCVKSGIRFVTGMFRFVPLTYVSVIA